MTQRFDQLKSEIFQRSQEKVNFDLATLEWNHVVLREIGESNCLCGQEIKHRHYLRHRATNEEVIIGSTCIFRFMQANQPLVEAAKLAEYEHVRHPCGRCQKMTKHPENCKRCDKLILVEQREREKMEQVRREEQILLDARHARLAREAKWGQVLTMINFEALNQGEHDFVLSVYYRGMNGRAMTPKQRAWLGKIIATKPSGKCHHVIEG